MGIVFGRTGCAEPVYNVLASRSSYEIREYESFIVASVNMAKNNEDNSFNTLAKYIGVFGTPENQQKEPMAMTAPVLFENNKNGEEMSFVLPFHMQHVNEVPAPLNRNIKIDKQTKKVLAVKSFSGWVNKMVETQKVNDLLNRLKEDNVLTDANRNADNVHYMVAQFHPPFTIPWLRRNEIWLELNEDEVRPFKK